MPKYHINIAGEVKECKAQAGNCPLGTASEHFDSPEEAQKAVDVVMSTEERLMGNLMDIYKEHNPHDYIELMEDYGGDWEAAAYDMLAEAKEAPYGMIDDGGFIMLTRSDLEATLDEDLTDTERENIKKSIAVIDTAIDDLKLLCYQKDTGTEWVIDFNKEDIVAPSESGKTRDYPEFDFNSLVTSSEPYEPSYLKEERLAGNLMDIIKEYKPEEYSRLMFDYDRDWEAASNDVVVDALVNSEKTLSEDSFVNNLKSKLEKSLEESDEESEKEHIKENINRLENILKDVNALAGNY